MADQLTLKQKEWADRYAYAMYKAGVLNTAKGAHPDTVRESWIDFKVQYHGYVADVPEEVRKSFRWNKMIEDTFSVFSDLEKRTLRKSP